MAEHKWVLPRKLTCPLKSMVWRCISYSNSPSLGDILVFGGVTGVKWGASISGVIPTITGFWAHLGTKLLITSRLQKMPPKRVGGAWATSFGWKILKKSKKSRQVKPPKTNMEPENTCLETSTNNQFWGSMLIFGGAWHEKREASCQEVLGLWDYLAIFTGISKVSLYFHPTQKRRPC